jgi:BlaI family penicillinase repressor
MTTNVGILYSMSGNSLPALSAAEQALMDLVWNHQPATVARLLELVNASRPEPITRNTLQTQLSRLEAKGWIRRAEGEKSLEYSAVVKEKKGRVGLLKDLKGRMFGGSTLSMMRCLVEEEGISKAEIAELRKLLDEHGKEGKP